MDGSEARLRTVEVRQASEVDLDTIVEQTWRVAAEGRWIGTEVPFDRAARRERLASALANESAAVLVADASGAHGPAVVGHISVSIAPYGVADIGMLITEEWRGRGTGTERSDHVAPLLVVDHIGARSSLLPAIPPGLDMRYAEDKLVRASQLWPASPT